MFKIGDIVRYKGTTCTGEIEAVLKDNYYIVSSVYTHGSDLELLTEEVRELIEQYHKAYEEWEQKMRELDDIREKLGMERIN